MFRRVGFAAVLCRGSFFANLRSCTTASGEDDSSSAFADRDEYDAVLKELEENKKLIEKLTTESLYKAAECQNLRKEMQEAKKNAELEAIAAFAKDMLELCDGLRVVVRQADEYLQQNESMPPSHASVLAGIKLTEGAAMATIKRHGISKICTTVGQPFDERLQEKLYTVPSTPELKDGSVAEIVKDGFLLNNSLLRKAQVAVSEGP
ncbi:putative co-chaperone GrpE [Leptomonas seymouri]|uniref:Putative co-chaperone GrpE n=1 Tax=Leptomonas seymouri TaxID=5684 RepID=A0A0N1HZM2_LEPSE|nr:putative co-chaperone GrpE [Leptomonas seymouri]|eukprot:KPI88710.1 putative co-chaperone GrpE [Leptomonas seymouri]